jgi:hypothetical protein
MNGSKKNNQEFSGIKGSHGKGLLALDNPKYPTATDVMFSYLEKMQKLLHSPCLKGNSSRHHIKACSVITSEQNKDPFSWGFLCTGKKRSM